MSTGTNTVEVTVRRAALVGWVADRSVGTKNLIGVALMALVAIGVGILSITSMAQLNDRLGQLKSRHLESVEQLVVIRQGVSENYRGQSLFSWAAYDPSLAPRADKAITDGDAMIDEAVARYRTRLAGSTTRESALNDFAKAWTDYSNLRDVVVFQKTAPAGVTVPTDPVARNTLWQNLEAQMNTSLAKLQQQEIVESDAMAAEAAGDYATARDWTIGSLLVGLGLALLLALAIARRMHQQLRSVSDTLRGVADGDLTLRADVYARDELGAMAAAMNRANESVGRTVQTLAAAAGTLGASTGRLTSVTTRIADSAKAAASRANVVAGDAGTVSHNVQTVAAGSEEMGASIREIAQNANNAAQVASEAVGVAESTNRTVSKLGDSSAEIGNVVKVITSIAEQTNLLALNATIEAARAGAAGKGFAVVASEVKDLAQETARATEDISRRVEAIQSDTANAVGAIGEISRIIARINDYQLTIASAVEEQTATTSEMSRSVSDAAHGAANIAGNIAGVADAADTTTATLSEVDATVAELNGLASDLQRAVGRFRI
ncbi:methyl-accepting chemotaxis protein [Dactylosporangium aurantiacum]|uniref:Methyl-accepting chemotaxis protein n=1 Tax=Dactylosporangium aurantiacum TaxID=35754 RepID=A0A9Q9MHB6_9ACTN|nr:methyl-accepting chemotaxis protein [Dactylosporangium aurantiacum]MDG6101722.1 methyl-accepting chemotaxis protein [Dactylosporangium aurantiacum]UWZ52466.1 methyl-accepting chemotaxis protein [Dactylosporangium aurantiacum]